MLEGSKSHMESEVIYPVPAVDFELVKDSEKYFIKDKKSGDTFPADKYLISMWLEREKMIERIHKMEIK